MIQFFINWAGQNLPSKRKQVLEKAKRLLRARADKRSDPLCGNRPGPNSAHPRRIRSAGPHRSCFGISVAATDL